MGTHVKQWFSRQRHRWLLPQRSLASQPMGAVRLVTQPVRRDGASPQALPTWAANTCKRPQMDESVHSQQQHDPCRPGNMLTEHHQCRHLREGLSVYFVTRQPYTFCSASKEEAAHLCVLKNVLSQK